MATFTRSISIKAPVDVVFDYWKNPANWPEVWPSMVSVGDVVLTSEGVGTSSTWVYKMAGIRLEGSGVFTGFEQNRRIEQATSGGVESTFLWTFEPEADGTRMSAVVDYEIPIPVLGRLVEKFVLSANEHEAEVTLANLKARLEHQPR